MSLINWIFLQLYGRDQPSKEEMMAHALRKKELCESVIDVMDKIIPGRFRLRGMFLSEIYGILFFLAKRAYDLGDIDRPQYLQRLQKAKEILQESIEVLHISSKWCQISNLTLKLTFPFQILSYEPLETVEGIRCQTTKEFLLQLEKMMASLKAEPESSCNGSTK